MRENLINSIIAHDFEGRASQSVYEQLDESSLIAIAKANKVPINKGALVPGLDSFKGTPTLTLRYEFGTGKAPAFSAGARKWGVILEAFDTGVLTLDNIRTFVNA